MQINYCLLPNEAQKIFGEHLERNYGQIVKFNYFAIATNPIPQKAYSLPKPPIDKSKSRKKISQPRDISPIPSPKLTAYYSPLIGGHINEVISCSTTILSKSSHSERFGQRALFS